MSFSTFFDIFALNENYVFGNAFGEPVEKPGAWGIVIIIGVDVDSNGFMIGPHIYKWGVQFLELGRVVPHEIIVDNHAVSMLICKSGVSRVASLD